jgi:hypothetical protein
MNYALGWVTETEAEKDGEGNEIPGTSQTVHVITALPPGLDEAGARNRDAIERACKRAVYEDGLEEFGNKKFVVVTYGEPFTVPFERTTVTQLLPPDKAAKVKAESKGVVTTEVPDEGDGDDGDDGDGDSDVAI